MIKMCESRENSVPIWMYVFEMERGNEWVKFWTNLEPGRGWCTGEDRMSTPIGLRFNHSKPLSSLVPFLISTQNRKTTAFAISESSKVPAGVSGFANASAPSSTAKCGVLFHQRKSDGLRVFGRVTGRRQGRVRVQLHQHRRNASSHVVPVLSQQWWHYISGWKGRTATDNRLHHVS